MEISKIKLAFPYEFFHSVDDNQKPIKTLKREEFCSKLKNIYPSDEKIERTKEIINLFNIKNGEELTKLYLKVM